MLEIRGIWLCHMSQWDRYVLRPRVWMETSRSETLSHIEPYSLLSSDTPGRLIHRSRGVTPSSVAPECLGDSKRRAGTRIHSSVVLMYAWFNRGSLAVLGHDKTCFEGC